MKKIFVFALLSLSFTSCNISKATYGDADKWVPADFDMNNGTVLIETYLGKDKWNTSMETFVAQHYPGKYLVVDKKDIENKSGKYSDATKYRFVFQWSKKTSLGIKNEMQIDWYGRIYDRATDKLYPTTRKTNNFGWKGYIPFINSIVKVSAKRATAQSPAK